MGKCPVCKKDIDYLIFTFTETNQSLLFRDGSLQGRGVISRNNHELRCPECGNKVADNFKDAMIILKGK